jgi:hypothetical protein
MRWGSHKKSTATANTNLDAAAFVIYHSVRATMLARLLEGPVGLSDAALVDELADLLLRYLLEEQAGVASQAASPVTLAPALDTAPAGS